MQKGIIKNYRRGVRTVYPNQVIVLVSGVDSKAKASKLVGKKAVWKSTAGKRIPGKVVSAHGGKGAVRVRFTKGLPGQCIGGKVAIV